MNALSLISFFIIVLIMGYYIIKYLHYMQDDIKSQLHFYEAFKYHIMERDDLAWKQLHKAIEIK